jgi:O-antigen ligase
LFWIAVTLASNRGPAKVLISYLSFSAQSSYNRILIWEYGTAEIWRHPLFGLGLGDWIRAPWMSDSMDNFWLITGVRYGLPALIFLVSALCVLAIRQRSATRGRPDLRPYRMAWLTTIVGLATCGTTVHFWNALFTYFFFLIGMGVWLTRPPKEVAKASERHPVQKKQHSYYFY